MAPTWDDAHAPASALRIPAGLNPPTWDDANIGWLFEGTGAGTPDETIYAIFHMPHTYCEGTSITPHLHWQPTTANAGNVYWQLQYTWLNDGETQAGLTTIFITPAVSGVAWQLQRDDFAAIAKANALAGSTVACVLTRLSTNVADTYNNDNALLKKFDLHHQIDAIGSVGIIGKWA